MTKLVEIPRRLASRWEWPVSRPVPVLVKPLVERTIAPTTTDHTELQALLATLPNNDTESMDYDTWRNVIFAIHHATEGSDEGLQLAHAFSARSPKYDPVFLEERVWPYVTTDGGHPITLATLRYYARQAENPLDDFEDLGPLPDPEPITVLPGEAPRERFQVIDEDAILQRPRPKWLVKNIIPEAGLVVIYGQSTAGKSFVTLDIFACVARGIPWREYKTQQRRVVYLAAEGQGGVRNRLEAYRQHHEQPTGLRMILDAPNFLKSDADLVAKQIIAAGGAEVIVVDTLAQVTPGGDENSAEDMGKALLSCRRLRAMTGAMIVLIHHAGKDATRGARGWSGLKAAADAELEVNRLEAQRWIKVSKSKDGEDGAEYPFKLIPVTLGQDEDGDPITSCVVGHMAKREASSNKEPKGKVERVVWRLAHELSDLGNEEIPVETLLTAAAKKLPHDPQSGRDRRREYSRQAITSLVEGGFLLLNENLVSVPGAGPNDEDILG